MELMNVNNFLIFTDTSKSGNFEVSGQVITKFTFQNWHRKILLYILFCLCYYQSVLFMALRAVRFTVCGASPDLPKQEMLFHKRAVHHEGRECLWHGLHSGVCGVYDSFNICVQYLHLKFVTLWRSKHWKCLSNHPKSIFQDQHKIHSETSRR